MLPRVLHVSILFGGQVLGGEGGVEVFASGIRTCMYFVNPPGILARGSTY